MSKLTINLLSLLAINDAIVHIFCMTGKLYILFHKKMEAFFSLVLFYTLKLRVTETKTEAFFGSQVPKKLSVIFIISTLLFLIG